MKNNKKFDGDKIYAITTTLFAGTCAIGTILIVAIGKIF